jgi:mannosyltransferase
MRFARITSAVVGLLGIIAAVAWSNSAIEVVLGRTPGELSWGPTLFRVLLGLHGGLLVFTATRSWRSSRNSATRASSPVTPAWAWPCMSGITIVAVALRLWKLGTGLWLDEILTLVDFVRLPAREIVSSFPSQNQHMLYSLLAHASVSVFGESAWSVRLPSVLFGVGSIWALFLLGRRILGVRQAILASALMTVSYHHIWFSQNARGYMGLLFFSILSAWIWLEALDRNQTKWYVVYAVSAALGIWVHMTMIFVIAGTAVIYMAGLLFKNSRERKAGFGPWMAWLLTGTFTLQLHALVVPQFLRDALHEVSMPSEWTNPLWVVTESIRSLNVGWSGAGVLVVGGAVLLAGWLRLTLRNPREILMMTLPPILGGGFMLAASHNLWPRFFFFAMGFALLILMGGIAELSNLFARRVMPARTSVAGTLSLVGGLALIAVSLLTVPRVYRLPKQDYIGARELAEKMRGGGNPIVAVGLAGTAYGKYYAPQWEIARTGTELETLGTRYSAITLVYTLPIELKAFHPDLWRVVEDSFEPVAAFPGTLGGGEVYVCRQRKPIRAALAPAELQQEVRFR